MSFLKALPVYTGTSGCDYHRVRLPFVYSGGMMDHEAYKGLSIGRFEDYAAISDVVVFNRSFPLGGHKRIAELQKKHGFKIVCDLDDWIELPPHHHLYKHYKYEASKEIIECMKLADAVTVTHERLAGKVRQFNNNVHVIPNALPFDQDQFSPDPVGRFDDPIFRFVYTGQSSHLEDVRLMQAPLNKCKQLNGIGFTLAGYQQSAVWASIEKVFSHLPNYKRIELQPLDTYMNVYNGADCSLVPLCNNTFNWHKSNLKLLEAAAKKIPCIVSHVPPYRDDEEAPVLWVKDPKDWERHISYLTNNRSFAKELGQQLYEWAKEKYDLKNWNECRFQLYDSLR